MQNWKKKKINIWPGSLWVRCQIFIQRAKEFKHSPNMCRLKFYTLCHKILKEHTHKVPLQILFHSFCSVSSSQGGQYNHTQRQVKELFLKSQKCSRTWWKDKSDAKVPHLSRYTLYFPEFNTLRLFGVQFTQRLMKIIYNKKKILVNFFILDLMTCKAAQIT